MEDTMNSAEGEWWDLASAVLRTPLEGRIFSVESPLEAENGSPGKDTLPISATVSSHIWLKAYLAGQLVAPSLVCCLLLALSGRRSLPKYPQLESRVAKRKAMESVMTESE